MIFNHGECWEYEKSGWGKCGRLKVNFATQIGIYVLYRGDKPIYVGRACKGKGTIGKRLDYHWKRRNKRRWTSYSWFGFKPDRNDGTLGNPPNKAVGYEAEICDVEALLIYLLNTPRNDIAGKHRHIKRFNQLAEDPT